MRHVTVLIDLRGVLGGVVIELLKEAYGDRAVAEVPREVPLAEAVNRARPQVVVTTLRNDADPAVATHMLTRLLDDHPRLRILVVEGDGQSGSLWELRPTRTLLGELSPQLLVRAIDSDHR
ncbi:hypothetical protein [Couchioplanes caeruleus]|uniref:Uncharacterized protein n=2 Tax=Couchioplanes caeruleus TaxID=56438 RepID=A0A1K0FN08_9ACTN|nr:hypothetical protein [Couchioplanes caeruleus]OJF14213.1 hypothetical protein BG844_11185 [Couchioplanes caeruleus subsp. caeruleus]ROP28339.1 hypothetical protein EDD30_1086 [Couchioplanes caeruleus]